MAQPAEPHPGIIDNPILICPHCGHKNNYQVRECINCGIDLALATGMAALALSSHQPASQRPMTPEVLVPRLGEILIERNLISQEGLRNALAYQKARQQSGETCLIGQSLLALKFIDRETLEAVVTEQILQLQSALQKANRQLEKRVEDRTQDLKQALTKLSELNQLKSNFIASVSHELRTPLTHLKGYLILLAEGDLGEMLPEQQQAVEVMVRAETRLEQLIDDLIQFSLMSRGEISLNKRVNSLSELVRSVTTKSRKLAKAREVELLVELQENLPEVEIDQDKISWVLQQLLDNAIKFTPQEGWVKVTGWKHGSLVTIRVTDNGIGMSSGQIADIFEPFYQVDGADTRRQGGTGLGLALVRRIVEMHGSVIRVDSEVGKGSSFEFSLPIYQDD